MHWFEINLFINLGKILHKNDLISFNKYGTI